MPFVKLDCKILDKSIWDESPSVCKVWITMLAMADGAGVVEAAITGIAARSRISVEETEAAILKFESPDKYSTNPENEGRRIERINSGFQILNYSIYREKDHTAAIRSRRYRERIGSLRRSATSRYTCSASASASSSDSLDLQEKKKKKEYPYGFDAFWNAYPRKVGKAKAEQVWGRLKPDAALVEKMLRALAWQRESKQWTKDGGEFIPHPTTWLNQKRWDDERDQPPKSQGPDYSTWESLNKGE